MSRSSIARARRSGFTLVEILIVVVILGILAAIVVPQFTNAANDARGGNLATQIRSIENQLELFRARTGQYPDIIGTGWGAVGTPNTMIGDGYLKTAPINPINGSATVGATPAAANGWHFDATTGIFGATYYNETTDVIEPNTP